METTNITRLEIIDFTDCAECDGHGQLPNGNECLVCGGMGIPGRSVVFWDKNKQVAFDLQDDKKH